MYVRGKQVPIRSKTINNYFGIKSEADEHSEYVAYTDEAEIDSVLVDLCVAGPEWSTSPQGALTFLKSDLKPEAKVWYHFLKTRLLLTTHIQIVTKEWALLLYSILQGRQINIGRVIHEEIYACTQKLRGILWFPNLISNLCEMKGVIMQDSEERLPNKEAITMFAIARISQERSHRQPWAELVEEDEHRPTAAQLSRGAETSTPRSSQMEYTLRQLEQHISLVEETQFTMMEELRQMQKEQKEYWSYVKARDKATQKNLKANSRCFHTFPAFPEHILQPLEDDLSDDE